jgi:hypothetical protein
MTIPLTRIEPQTRLRLRPTATQKRRRQTRRSSPQPLYEALAVGLGCISVDHKLQPPPEWM